MGDDVKKPPVNVNFKAGDHNWPEAAMFISIVACVGFVKYLRIKAKK